MPLPLVLTVVGVFASVLCLVFGVSMLLAGGSLTGRRLLEVTKSATSGGKVLAELMPLQATEQTGFLADAAKLMAKTPKEMGRLRARMTRAGLKSPTAPTLYSLSEVVCPVLLAAPPLLLLHGPLRWVAAAVGAALGFFGPGLYVERCIKGRQREIENGLPDALDLLVVCIEAGSGLDQAVMKTADELILTYPALGEELRMVNTEIRAGKPRMEAFKALAERTRVDEIRSLVGMLVQTDRFGTSVGQALRTHSETSRTKRRQRAEEAAQKIGVKLVFPLVLFFFPAFYVVVLGSAAIQFMRTFN